MIQRLPQWEFEKVSIIVAITSSVSNNLASHFSIDITLKFDELLSSENAFKHFFYSFHIRIDTFTSK